MAWHLQIGFDDKIMNKVHSTTFQRQKFVYSSIVVMIIIISLFVFTSSLVYSSIIFHNWYISVFTGLFLALIIFNIYRFIIVTSINAQNTNLGSYHINHEKHYQDFKNQKNKFEFAKLSDETIIKIVNERKDKLRINEIDKFSDQYKITSSAFTFIIRIIILSIIAILFATGIEILLFKEKINFILNETLISLQTSAPDSWVLNNILKPKSGEEFLLLKCNSLLLILDVLEKGLGAWKLLLDLIIISIFLIPLILISKSKEIKNGEYVRELALHEISISFYHFLKTQKYCNEILSNHKN